jgi:Protein of unknown function (DUF3570)
LKRNWFLIGSFSFLSFFAQAQKTDSLFKKQNLKKNEIDFLYSHYIQDGNKSAVTGGIGTEALIVYAPQLTVRHTYKNGTQLTTNAGVDVVTSASTDNIDYVMSSASLHDVRFHADVAYTRYKNNTVITGGGGVSVESDYFSLPFNLGIVVSEKSGMRTYGVELKTFFDDLRWGRISDLFRPETLIYPSELRYKEWYKEYNRNSYNLKFSFTQILNKRNRLGVYPEVSYQNGLLATPFHRVYFDDNSLRVENLPTERWKATLGLKLNTFVGGRTILKNGIDFYSDSFAVQAIGIENETAIKLTPQFILAPSFRLYFQKGSTYFAAYKEHMVTEEFYTSDYDLSTMTTQKGGIAIRYSPAPTENKKIIFSQIEFSYSFYSRSNGLTAHVISCGLKGIGTSRNSR